MSSCKRCGQCCRLGGPVLHRDDLSLLDRLDAPAKGTVPFGMADLVTLRTGELVRDDVIGTLTPLESECVKLAPARGRTDWECRFLVRMPGAVPGRDAGCGIYDRRPAQCRALSCSEKEATEALLETVRYDISFRQLCVERGNIPEGCLPFLLGRPLSETLVMFGLALARNNNRMGLVRRGEGRYGGPVFPDGKDLYR